MIKKMGMTNQQVYNSLQRKRALLPNKSDNVAYTISLCSIVISITNTFVRPLENGAGANYTEYVAVVLCVLFLCGFTIHVIYKVIISLNKSSEMAFLEKYNYEYIIKLLEDLLY